MKILLIAGHGAGDPGACANGYKEAELTREVVATLKPLLSKHASVTVFDTSKNMYEYLKKNVFNFKQFDYVFEVHFNAFYGKASGAEVLVHATEKGTTVEQAILDKVCKVGFKNRGVKHRSDLLVMNTCKKKFGVSHALIEVCFIDSASDMKIYQANKDKIAKAIVDGIAEGFGLNKSVPDTAEQAINKLVKAGLINSPDYWLKTAKSVKHLDTLLIKIAKTL